MTGGAGVIAGTAVAILGFEVALAGLILPLAGNALAEFGTVFQSVGKNGKISPRPSKEDSKTVDDILEDAKPGRNPNGRGIEIRYGE